MNASNPPAAQHAAPPTAEQEAAPRSDAGPGAPRWMPLAAWLLSAFIVLTLTLYIDRMRWTNEEPRRAIVAQEMILTGEYFAPTVFQEPYFKKPPLHNWTIALAAGADRVVTPAEARLVSLAAFLLVGLMAMGLLRPASHRRGYVAFFVVMTMYLMLCEYGNMAEPDMLLTLLTFAAFFVYVRGPRSAPHIAASGLLVGLGILTKGVSPLFFYPPVLLYTLIHTHDRRRRCAWLGLHALIALLPPLAWAGIIYQKGLLPQLLAVSGSELTEKAMRSIWAFLTHLLEYPLKILLVTLPWTGLVWAAWRRAPRRDAVYWISLYAFGIALLVFTLIAGSRDRYMLPALPFLAVWVSYHFDPERRAPAIVSRLLVLAAGGACIAMGVYLLQHAQPLQGALLCGIGVLAAPLAMPRYSYLKLGLVLALLMLLFYEHGLYFYRSVYRPRAYPIARQIEMTLMRDLPVMVEPRADLIHLAVDLEGMIQRPVYHRDLFDFPEYYLITDLEHRVPGARDLMQTFYSRRREADIVLQEVRAAELE